MGPVYWLIRVPRSMVLGYSDKHVREHKNGYEPQSKRNISSLNTWIHGPLYLFNSETKVPFGPPSQYKVNDYSSSKILYSLR